MSVVVRVQGRAGAEGKMTRWMTGVGAAIALWAATAGVALAQGAAEEVELLRGIESVRPTSGSCEARHGDKGSPLLFIVDKGGAPVFPTADATAPSNSGPLPLGTPLFADDVRADCARVRVLRLGSDSVVQRVGWMQTEDLLVNQRAALEIGDALEFGLNVERSEVDGGFNESNRLRLRFVTIPELQLRLGVRPGDESGDSLSSYKWFYVYDLEEHDGEIWGLLGEVARLFAARGVESTDRATAEGVLPGWVPLSKLQIWATNLALELNTHPDAVAGRLERGYGARVLELRRPDSKTVFEEPLNYLWPSGEANRDIRDIIDFDPYGISPEYPRLAVVQAYSNFISVASAGSRKEEMLPSEIGRITRKITSVAEDLRKVDIVFVLDTTGSMRAAIERTRDFLNKISDSMRATATSGGTEVVDFGVLGKLEVSTNLDISVSLIGFQDIPEVATERGTYTTHEFFSGQEIVRDFDSIRGGFTQATLELDGGAEALHHGILEALNDRYWRLGASSRVIVVVTDEPGVTDMQGDVYNAMSIYPAELLEINPRFGEISTDDQKKQLTNIFSIYLGPEKYEGQEWLASFRRHSELYSRELFEIIDFADGRKAQDFLDALGEVLVQRQSEVLSTLKVYGELLKRGSSTDFGAFPGLTELAVRQAMSRQGLTVKEIDQLNDVVFYEGFVEFDHVGGLAGGDAADLRRKDWRTRVHLERGVVASLYQTTNEVARALDSVLSDDQFFGDLVDAEDTATRRELVMQLMILVRDAVTGENRFADREGSRDTLRKWIEGLLKRIDENPDLRDATFAEFLRVDSSLPFRTDGLLSIPMGEMLSKTKDWFLLQRDQYNLKARGLENILSGRTVPEDFRTVLTSERADRRWFTPTGLNAVEEHGYIPPGYLP